MGSSEIERVEVITPTPILVEQELLKIGSWYWVKDDEEENKCHFMCITHIGTNMAVFRTPPLDKYEQYVSFRVHFDEWARCTLEPEYRLYISMQVDHYRERANELREEVKEVTARLGVTPRTELDAGAQSTALTTLNSQDNVDDYKTSLIEAHKKKLPELFEKLKENNLMLTNWMKAEVIPMTAMGAALKGVLGKVESRIFNVELYAGLTEQVVQVRAGDPPGLKERLRFMQRRHYMDEECLAKYRHGGMNFQGIEDFDEWIAEDKNLLRLLPFPRCMIAFKVRRNTKNYSYVLDPYVRFDLKEADKLTFMYIRNGEQLFRMSTQLPFGHKIFPDTKEFDLGNMWARVRGSHHIL